MKMKGIYKIFSSGINCMSMKDRNRKGKEEKLWKQQTHVAIYHIGLIGLNRSSNDKPNVIVTSLIQKLVLVEQ